MEKNNITLNIEDSTLLDIPCVILCGGKSSRMGEDKSLLPFCGFDTMIEYQYNKLTTFFKDVYISSKTDKFESLKNKVNGISENIIFDKITDESSPMVALQTIFDKIDSDYIFIITVDVPFIKKETIKSLVYNSQGYDITIASDEKRVHNLCGVFSKNISKNINEALNNGIHKVNFLIKSTPKKQIINFYDQEEFLNLNEKNTYLEAIDISKSYCKY